MEMAYVKVYQDWAKATAKLKDAEKGRLIDAMVVYATTGEDHSDALSGNEQYLFPMFQAQIDRDRQALADYSKKQSANGAKGGRPKKAKGFSENQKVFEEPKGFSENPKNPPLFSETQKSQDKEKEKDKEVVPPYPPQGETAGGAAYIANNLRGMTAGNWDELRSYMEDGISMPLICYAVDEAAANGKRSWSYVRGILNRFLTEGISTVEQARKTSERPKEQPEMGYRSKWVGEDD